MSGIANETINTYSVHWFNGGWLDDKMKRMNEESRNKYVKIYRKITIGKLRYKFEKYCFEI